MGKHRSSSAGRETVQATGPGLVREPAKKRHIPFAVWGFLLVAAATVFLVYSNTFQAPFLFDDRPNILDNEHIRLTGISLDGLRDAAFKSVCPNRPVAKVSFALNHYFHQYDLFGYHLVNTLIHLLTGVFLFFLLKQTFAMVRASGSDRLLPGESDTAYMAAFAAILWLVHPLNTQAVTYIVQRMASMAAMFYVLSLLCYVQGRIRLGSARWALYAGSLISGLLAFGSKEISATLPVFVFAYEWYFFQNLDTAWLKKKLPFILVPAAVIGVLAFFYLGANPWERILAGYERREFTLPQRVMTEFRVVVFYLSQIAFPHPSRLSLEHDFPVSHSLLDPVSTILSLGALVLLGVTAVFTARRYRLVSFAILWFLGNMVIESSVLGLEIIFEHRTYLPSMLLIALVPVAAFRFAKPAWVAGAALCVAAVVLSVWTWQRNAVWADELTLLRDNVIKAPGSPRPYNNLGLALQSRGQVDEAVENLSRALELSPNRYAIYRNLAGALAEKGSYDEALHYYEQGLFLASGRGGEEDFHIGIGRVLEKQGKVEDAAGHYRQAIGFNSGSESAHNLLGKLHAQQGNFTEAVSHLNEALRIDPGFAEARNNLGNVHIQQGKADEALRCYHRSIEADPEYADARYNLANLLKDQGKQMEALAQYEKVVEIEPGHLDARLSLAVLLYRRGELDRAVEHLEAAVRIHPDNQQLHENLDMVRSRRDSLAESIASVRQDLYSNPDDPALLFRQGELQRLSGDFAGAAESYRKAVSVSSGFVKAMHQLAVVYSLTGDYARAAAQMKKVAEMNPNDPDALYNLACIYSRQGRVEESLQCLQKAIEKGFRDWSLMKTDTDLLNIRHTQAYRELIREK